MPKKTEAELRQEIIEEFDFEENDERIDKILEVKKDRYAATQAKKKAQEDAENYKKGKDFYKSKADPKGGKEPKGKDIYSLADIRALSDVHDDDVDSIVKFAKFEGVSIPEAKKHSDMQAILKNRAEQRKTAEAANTGQGKRDSGKVTAEGVLQKAERNQELSDADIKALADSRYQAEA